MRGTVLFHETFGNNTSSARAWDDSYSVKSGVSSVYSGVTGYTITNAKQSINTGGSTQSGLIQTTSGTDAVFIVGPLSVASYNSLVVTYQWKAASIKKTYSTSLYYKTSSGGSYTEVSGTGNGATTYVTRTYNLPVAAQVSTLYIKVVFNTSNTQALIDEFELTGTAAVVSCTTNPTVTASSNSSITSTTARVSCSSGISSLGSAGCSISSYGFVMNTTGTPTISDTKLQVGTTYTTTGTSFSKNLTDLTPGTTYYVRSYATNGNGTAYGSQTNFTTKNRYNLTFKETDGTNNGSGTVVEDSTAIRITSAPSKDYYDLEGFYTTSGLGTKIATAAGALQNGSGSGITVGGNAWTNGSSQWKRGAGETFYLNWTPKDYAITTTLSNCSWSSAISSPYTYDGSSDPITRTVNPSSGYTCPPNITVTMGGSTLTKGTDYTWSVNGTTGVGSFTLNKVITGAVAITITAEQLFTVTFNKGTGTCATSSLKGTNAAGVTLPTPTHHCDGWSFAGWTTGSLITTETGSAPATLYTGGSTYKPSADITLYAVYKHGDAKYHLVTTLPTGDDIAGNYMVVNTSNKKAMDAFVTSSYYLDNESISAITDNAINYADAGTYKHYTKWEVSYSSSAWHFYNTYTSKYLYNYVSSTNHYLGINSTKQNGYDLSLSSGYAVFTSKDDVGAHIYWDDSNSRFAATTGSTNNLHLYKEDPLVYFSNPSCCTPHDISRAGTPAGTVTGGTFTVNKASACEDAEVTLTATPSSKQYVFKAWTVTETADPTNDITSTNVDGNTLTMPNFAVTVNAEFSAISSIAVKTAPTKTTYCAGEYFDPTGLVITATYANSATQDISYASDAALFTFSPATNAALATNNSSVSITVGGQSTSQSITVNAVRTITLTGSGTVTGGSFTSDESSACVGATITLTPDADEHYSFTSWTITKAGGGTVTPVGNTFTMPDDNVTVNAMFTEDAYHYATFKNDLAAVSGYDHVKVYDGTKPTPPTMTDVTDACDKTECNLFYGWIAEAGIWDETLDDISAKVIYRSASSLPNVSGADVTYHAVWAKGSAAPAVTTPTPIVAWNKNGSGISASTNYSANTGTGTLTSNIDMSSTGYSFMNTNTGISTAPVITLSGLNLSGASTSTVNISFYTRGSKTSAGTLTVEYSSNNGSSYSTAGTVTIQDGIINHHEITGIPKTTNQIRLTHALSTGSFSIGTFKIYEPVSGTWNFTELTSANTSGWTTTDWEGDYIITNGSTTALNGYYFEDNKCLVTVSPSTGVISLNANDAGNAFRITYSAENSGYSVQGIGGGLYLKYKNNSVDRSESAENYYSMGYNSIICTLIPLQWNSTKFGFYSGSYTSLKLYKTLSTYTKWRISCCEKHDITKDGDPAGTVTGGSFTVDKTSACEGTTITLSVTSISSGYNFDHWTVVPTGGGDALTVTDNQFTMPNEAVTVTAVFVAAHTTTVTLNAQGGVGGTSSVTATVNLPMPDATMPTKSGYEFGGYYSAPNGSGTQYYDADGNSAHVWDDGESDNATLYAKWTASGYTVTLNKEGATTQGTASVSVTFGANTNLTSAITCPSWDGKVFGGYWTTASGDGTRLIDQDGNWLPSVASYTDVNRNWLYANDLELHARWSNVSYANYRTTCGPEITVTGGPVYLTSYAGCEVLTTGNITVSSENWQSTGGAPKFLSIKFKNMVTGVTYTHTSSSDAGATQKIVNSECRAYYAAGNGGSVADGGYIALPTNGTNPSYDFRIAYTPTAGEYNTRDHYIVLVEVYDNSGTKKTLTMETVDLYGRTLPEQFIIVAKKDGKWWALPNDLAGTEAAAKAAKAIEIIVDNTTTPTAAIYAPENTLYKAARYYTGPTVANQNRSGVRFTRNGSQYLQVSTVEGTNVMWLSATGGTDVQDWYLDGGTAFANYTIKLDPRMGTGGYKDKKMGIFGSNFGFYTTPTAYDIYLLPVETVLAEAEVVEWGKHSAIIEADAGPTGFNAASVIGRIGDEATTPIAVAETKTSYKGGATKYNYTVNFGNTFDFTTEKDNKLYLDWLNGSGTVVATSMIDIPWIIDGTKTMSVVDGQKTHWSSAEVHVLPGAVLTADAETFSGVTIGTLEIYPGATVKVTTGTLNVSDLVLRYGWTRASGKDYNSAQLQIKRGVGGANLTTTRAYADWYIDYDQFYSMSVPWTVTTSNIRYRNTNSAANTSSVKIRYYDGENRAATGQTQIGQNWKDYNPWPTYLEPSKGYAISAKRPTGKAFSILRMPLTIPSSAWTALGEQGYVESTHKDQVSVTGWGKGTAEWYAMGWNFIGNPYMSTFNGDDSGIIGKLELQNGGTIRYATIPDLGFHNYDQVAIADANILPANGFFIQANDAAAQIVTFNADNIVNPTAPARFTTSSESVPDQEAYIRLSYEGGKDQMGLIIGEDYTENYEANADLAKVLGDAGYVKTYMQYGGMDMAYVAINEELAKAWIPVTVILPANGEYTYSLMSSSEVDELEGVYLIDYANDDKVTNLINENYTFTADAGTISNRFAINAIVGERQIPTDIDVVNEGGDLNSDKPFKFLYHEKVYIYHRGVIYDATGKRVKEINK